MKIYLRQGTPTCSSSRKESGRDRLWNQPCAFMLNLKSGATVVVGLREEAHGKS